MGRGQRRFISRDSETNEQLKRFERDEMRSQDKKEESSFQGVGRQLMNLDTAEWHTHHLLQVVLDTVM